MLFLSSTFHLDLAFGLFTLGAFLTTQAEDSVIKSALSDLEKGFVDFDKTCFLNFSTFIYSS